MKKVIFLVPWLSGYGGTEVVIHNLFKEYYKNKSKINFDFELYSLGGFLQNTNLHFKNIHVVQLLNNKYLREIMYIFLLPLLIPYIIFKEHADVVISTNPILWTISKIFVKLFNLHIPIIAWYQYSYNAKHVSDYYVNKPDYFFTISADEKKELLNRGVQSKLIHVIYNPVIPSNKTIVHSLTHNHFVYVGRIEYGKQKNIQELFKALSIIRNPWQLKIYGTGLKKDIYRLKNLSKHLKINKYIKWMGFQKNVFDNIHVADALLLTSNYEGFPMVIAEAISHGLYVISSNCPNGPYELIKSNNGNLYEMHHINQLVKLINNVISGKQMINYNNVKQSINFLYINKYFERFIRSLKLIINRK